MSHTRSSIITLAALALLAGTVQAVVTTATTNTSTVVQLTDYLSPTSFQHDSTAPEISRDGSTVVFNSTADLVQGLNPNHLENIYIMNSDGSGLRQLTAATIPTTPVNLTSYYNTTTTPRLSANGKVVVFASYFDLTGENPPEYIVDPDYPDYSYYLPNYQLFIINSDGTALRQLTHGRGGHSLKPRISDDGRTIAFESTHDLVGANSDRTQEIFVINAEGTGLTQITLGGPKPAGRNIRDDESRNVSISGDGTTIAFDSFNDLLPPRNDDWSNEIFLFDLARYRREGGSISTLQNFTVQITDTDVDAPFHTRAEDSFEPSLSHDGSVVVFSACINPVGDNPFLSDAIFMARRNGTGLRQLTFSDDPNAYKNDTTWSNKDDDVHWPQISADGTKVVFATRSRADLTPGSRLYEIAMIDLNAPLDPNGRPVVEQLSSQVRPYVTQLTFNGTDGARLRPSISADASRVVLRTSSDFTGGNRDRNSEIFLIAPLVVPTPSVPAPDAGTPAPVTSAPIVTPITDTQSLAAPADETSGNTDNGQTGLSTDTSTERSSGGGGGTISLIDLLFGIAALGACVRRRRTAGVSQG